MASRKRRGRKDQVSAFAMRLRALRDSSGGPSPAELAQLTHETPWPQSAANIQHRLANTSDLSEEFVKAVVTACALHAARTGMRLSETDGDVEAWVLSWRQARGMTTAPRRADRVETSPAPEPGPRAVRDWDPVHLGVHAVIQVDGRAPWRNPLPLYRSRRHDRTLRRLLVEPTGQARLIILVGDSSTGKSRAAYEAVSECVPSWPLYAPPAARDLARSVARNELHAPCVLWLDDARDYLEDQDVATWLFEQVRHPLNPDLIVIATLWPSDWVALEAVGERDPDVRFRSAKLLRLSVRLDVPDKFDHADIEWARGQSRADPLMAAAVREGGSSGRITQALAAGPWLDHYYHDAGPQIRAALTAAMELRRLGYGGLIPEDYLRTAATSYLDDERRAEASSDWFSRALRDCTVKLKGVAAPLTPIRTQPGAGAPDGYRLAGYLDQRGRDILRGQPPPGAAWQAAEDYVRGSAERGGLAREAARRGLLEQAYILARPAAEAGDVRAMGVIAAQHERWRQKEVAQDWWRKAARAGDSAAMCRLAEYEEGCGNPGDAKEWWQRGADLGNPYAMWHLADRLDRDGCAARADEILTEAAEAGDPFALNEMMRRLRQQERNDEAISLARRVAERGHMASAQAMDGIGQLASALTWANRAQEAEFALRAAAKRGDAAAMLDLARLLHREGRADEAAMWRRHGADQGYPPAIQDLAVEYLRVGETDQAEEWLQVLSEVGHLYGMWLLADVQDRTGRAAEALSTRNRAVRYGDGRALRYLTDRLERAGCQVEAESGLRRAIEAGAAGTLAELAMFVERQGRPDEARELRVFGMEPGGRTAGRWGLAVR